MSTQTNYIKVNDAWKGLFSSKDRMKGRLNKLNISIDKGFFNVKEFTLICEDRKKAIRASELVKSAAEARLSEIQAFLNSGDLSNSKPKVYIDTKGGVELSENGKETANSEKKDSAKKFLKQLTLVSKYIRLSELFLNPQIAFVFLCFAILLQVKHMAWLVDHVSENDNYYVGVLFGLAAECTAIIFTLHNNAKKGFLLVYAVLQFWVNILYYKIFPFTFTREINGESISVEYWQEVTQATLAFILAFVIYSYSEIFTKIFKEDPK